MILLKIFLGIITVIIFLISFSFFGWIAFAIGPMRCSLPNHCTTWQAISYTIYSLLVISIPFAFVIFSFIGISRL